MRTLVGTLVLATGLAVTAAMAAEKKSDVKSGPQAGEPFAGTFEVKAVTGDDAGKSLCYT